jgi:hypothetical protein
MLWNSYGKDKISTDGRWRLQYNHIAGVSTWWVIYEHHPEGTKYRGQKDTLRQAKGYIEELIKEEQTCPQ